MIEKGMKHACTHVRITVRRVTRHPLTKKTLRSGTLLQKHFIRGATFGIVPSAVNDVVFHHAPLNIGEVIHVTQDVVTVSTMNVLASAIIIATKVL
jgi:hypothetical protein